MALTISGGGNYSGSRGGNAGGSGSSGAGGGSGGATVLLLTGTVLGVAGGGGGGGGGGNTGAATGQSAPGARGQAVFPISNGQNGTNKSGDGGGGGGGGGGYNGGNGGQTPGGDIGGEAGSFGSSYSNIGITADPSNRQPAYQASGAKYWSTERAAGGSPRAQGTVGYAVLEFDVLGSFVKDAGAWQPIDTAYIKLSGVWRQIQATYVKQGGVWQPIFGSFSPTTSQNAAQVGTNPREADDNAGQGGGGGSSCVVSTAFADRGIWDVQQKQELIAWCEDKLHNRILGECFRRGYQVVGSKAGLPLLKTAWGRAYATWAFTQGTNMVQGKKFSAWSVPNSVLWIMAFMLTGAVVTTNYANACWKSIKRN